MGKEEEEDNLLVAVYKVLELGTHAGLSGAHVVALGVIISAFKEFVESVKYGKYVIVDGDAYNALIKGQSPSAGDIGPSDTI